MGADIARLLAYRPSSSVPQDSVHGPFSSYFTKEVVAYPSQEVKDGGGLEYMVEEQRRENRLSQLSHI